LQLAWNAETQIQQSQNKTDQAATTRPRCQQGYNMWKLNVQLILTWYFLTCIPPGLIAPNLLNSCPTISTVASKGKFLIKTEYPGSKDKASLQFRIKTTPFLSFV
jgi:hypothetical protein